MADDTRQTENSPAADNATQEPEKRRRRPRSDFPATQSSKMWEAFGNPDQPANSMPGGTYNSAGGKPKEVGWTDALSFEVFNSDKRPPFWKTGCARDSILVGMGSGAGVGGLHFILRGLQTATTNIAVGAFALTSLSMFYWCTERRKKEASGMAQAMAGMRMLNEKKARDKAKAEEAAAKMAAEKEKKKSSWW